MGSRGNWWRSWGRWGEGAGGKDQVGILFYVLKARPKNGDSQSDIARLHLSFRDTSSKITPNDKIVLIDNANYSDLKVVLLGFCKLYNTADYQARPRLNKLSDRGFAITFPYNIDFDIFCYFINYIQYPNEIKWAVHVSGWATTKMGDNWITEKSMNKKVMLFIPTDDNEHDNVFMTTSDNIDFKLGFAIGEQNQLLDRPKELFVSPRIDISELADKGFEDFK
jgi:hypothetical protein